MSPKEEELFHQLIAASGKLATVADNAAVVLSEQFEGMVRPSVDEVRAILAQCPVSQEAWDGSIRDEDITEKLFPAPAPVGEEKSGVELVHSITGITRQSYTKATVEENRAVARRSLEQAVLGRAASLSRGA